MLSPYEGERIFEAEMVRLHQCDRNFYACAQQSTQDEQAPASVWGWLARILPGHARTTAQQLPAASAKLEPVPSPER